MRRIEGRGPKDLRIFPIAPSLDPPPQYTLRHSKRKDSPRSGDPALNGRVDDHISHGYPAYSEKYDHSSLGIWHLPGHGEAYDDCGDWRARGCENVGGHPAGLDRVAGGIVVEFYKRRCMRKECPICYEAWAGKEAQRIDHRLRSFKLDRFRKVIHLIASVPIEDYSLSFTDLRRKAYKIVKKARFIGGCCIFHPFRLREDRWYFSPHFHFLGFGWIMGTKNLFEESRWIVKNVGVRKSVLGTALYQLSHAGVSEKGYHVVTWFGSLSYNKLAVDPLPQEVHVCPICGHEFVKMFMGQFTGLDPPEAGVYYLVGGVLFGI